jgi:hypothetical protein
MNTPDLCMALMRADTEDEVVDLLETAGYWDDPNAWRYLGDNENNFATIGNQQSEAVAALIEKIVNSVDARLTNSCWEAGVDPTSEAAPRSIREGVARFFDPVRQPGAEKAGRVALWSDAETTAQARLLTVAATGHAPGDGNPSITVADEGEGQTPDSFPDTFMSLEKSNKLRIPFVQGKFNMGGTGALQFCSQHYRLQLIVSRRNPALLGSGHSKRDEEWGFTVVRREPPTGGTRSSVFTYLAPVGAGIDRKGQVLSFRADDWPIFPEADADVRDAYHRCAPYGSLVKLFEYRWQGTRSNIVSSGGGLLRRIDLGLVEVALPVRVFECRPTYKGHAGSFATNVLGLAARLERDKADNLEPGFPVGSIIDLDGKQVRTRVFAFKKGRALEYRTARHGLVFAVNGQAHASFPIDFFRRKNVGMSYLADSLLVIVDCTNIEGEMREDLFMNSRDRLRSNPLSQRLENEIALFLKDDPQLRALRNRRRQEDLEDKLADSKPLTHVLEELLRQSPSLAKLFLAGLKLPTPFPMGGTGTGTGDKFIGKTYPTFFRFHGLKDGEVLERAAHLGSRPRVGFETDASDDYFYRELDPGRVTLREDPDGRSVEAKDWAMHGPRAGVATLTLELPYGAHSGKDFHFEMQVTDPSRVEPFTNRFVLKVRPPAPKGPGGKGGRRTATSGMGGKGGPGGLSLPNIAEIREPDWAEHGFDELSALGIKHAGAGDGEATDVYDFFVNVDNKYLRLIEKESREEPKLIKARFVYALVLIGMALIQDDRSKPADAAEDGDESEEGPSVEQVVASTTRALAPVLLPMIETIGSLSIEDAGNDEED